MAIRDGLCGSLAQCSQKAVLHARSIPKLLKRSMRAAAKAGQGACTKHSAPVWLYKTHKKPLPRCLVLRLICRRCSKAAAGPPEGRSHGALRFDGHTIYSEALTDCSVSALNPTIPALTQSVRCRRSSKATAGSCKGRLHGARCQRGHNNPQRGTNGLCPPLPQALPPQRPGHRQCHPACAHPARQGSRLHIQVQLLSQALVVLEACAQ